MASGEASSLKTKGSVVVLGAGITGLTTALRLLDAGYKVTIIAKTLPPVLGEDVVPDEAAEYASFWAGAHWRTHAKKDDFEQQKWDLETYVQWLEVVEEEKARETRGEVIKEEDRTGIAIRQSTITWSSPKHPELSPSGDVQSLWWARHVRDFTQLSPTSVRFTALAVNVPRYIAHLHSRIRAHPHATIIQASLPLSNGLPATLQQALTLAYLSPASCAGIVNALGLSARRLYATDPSSIAQAETARLHPIRGQTVLARGELREIRTLQSFDPSTGKTGITYAIPRPGSGTTVLGGCNIKDDWSTEVDDVMTKEILQNCAKLVPELCKDGEFEVIKAQVGLRPGRTGGARLEREMVRIGDWRDEVVVVHAYCMAGAGFQNSVGVARKVLSLLEGGYASEERSKL